MWWQYSDNWVARIYILSLGITSDSTAGNYRPKVINPYCNIAYIVQVVIIKQLHERVCINVILGTTVMQSGTRRTIKTKRIAEK